MEIQPSKYTRGKIYKVISNQTDLIYIGSTIRPLSERLSEHKKNFRGYSSTKKGSYVSVYLLLENYDDCQIILIENYPCSSKEELHSRERYHIEINRYFCINMNIPTRTSKERYVDNRDLILEERRQYYEENKSEILDRGRLYYQRNSDRIKERQRKYAEERDRSDYNKEYRELNKERLNQYSSEYYQTNKGKWSEKIKCECGAEVARSSLSQHRTRQVHLKSIALLSQST